MTSPTSTSRNSMNSSTTSTALATILSASNSSVLGGGPTSAAANLGSSGNDPVYTTTILPGTVTIISSPTHNTQPGLVSTIPVAGSAGQDPTYTFDETASTFTSVSTVIGAPGQSSSTSSSLPIRSVAPSESSIEAWDRLTYNDSFHWW